MNLLTRCRVLYPWAEYIAKWVGIEDSARDTPLCYMHVVAISWRAECGNCHDVTAEIRKHSLEKAKSEAKAQGSCPPTPAALSGSVNWSTRVKSAPRGLGSTCSDLAHKDSYFPLLPRTHPEECHGPMAAWPLMRQPFNLVKRDVLLRFRPLTSLSQLPIFGERLTKLFPIMSSTPFRCSTFLGSHTSKPSTEIYNDG